MFILKLISAIGLVLICVGPIQAADTDDTIDPYWPTLHESAVVNELKLSPTQREDYFKLLDELDLRFFPLRNQPSNVALPQAAKIIDEARTRLKELLQTAQTERLEQIALQRLGNAALTRDDLAKELKYTAAQRKRMKDIQAESKAAVDQLTEQSKDGGNTDSINTQYRKIKTNEQKKLVAVLKADQLAAFRQKVGPLFSESELGKTAFKAPDLVDTGEWINSEPIDSSQLRGKVVVIHFYAFGCINCIHNYPWYKQWSDQFKDRDVVIIGIHTPETSKERVADDVRRKAAEEQFKFPIVIDGKNENWSAWGNSIWPCVYLVDKRGYLRDFWAGELKWQGRDGEKQIREKIEALLAEPAASIKEQGI